MAKTSPGPSVPSVAERQGGVFTIAQARAEGWGDRTIRRRIAGRRWVYVAGQALAAPSSARHAAVGQTLRGRGQADEGEGWTAFQLAMAARLSYPLAVVSHQTAAVLHGFPGLNQREQVCDVTFTGRRRAGRAIRVHLLRLGRADVEVRRPGLQITSADRTALDCLATLPFHAALDLWAWVSTRRILNQTRLAGAIAERHGWYGTPQLKRLAKLTATGAISAAEFRFQELLRAAGLTGWAANVPILDGTDVIAVADVAFLTFRVIIEIDGWSAHSSRASFEADRRRQNRLVAAGYTVLRFTWSDLTDRPADVLAQVRAALSRSAHLA
jgi:hypothetical protein